MYRIVDKEFLLRIPVGKVKYFLEFIKSSEEFGTLQTIPPDISVDTFKIFLDDNNIICFYFFCPYCRVYGYLATHPKSEDLLEAHPMESLRCVYCGEADPIWKYQKCLRKVKHIMDHIGTIEEIDTTGIEPPVKRILLEQSLVIMVTGLEIFLKEIYSTLMNVRNTKIDKNLYPRFLKDVKNKFTNPERAKEYYYKDLGIQLDQLIYDWHAINYLFQARHILVHNNGYVDKSFLVNTKALFPLGSIVPLAVMDIEAWSEQLDLFVDAVNQKYFYPEMTNELIELITHEDTR